jgi:hypothetical protein
MKPTLIKTTAKRILLSFAFIAISFAWTGCEKDYNYIAPAPVNPGPNPDPGGAKTVFFATDIQPIFNASCNMSGCHDGAMSDPDLRVGNAYGALAGYINTAAPASSSIYTEVTLPAGSPVMPASGTPLTAEQTGKILTWIQEGATNN